MNIEIDVEQFACDIKAGKSIGHEDGALISLIKQLTDTFNSISPLLYLILSYSYYFTSSNVIYFLTVLIWTPLFLEIA